jgi:hypothetical protein
MLLVAGPESRLGTNEARLRFHEEAKKPGGFAGRRVLSLDGSPAFDLSFWCGTCPFLFERLEGANQKLSLDHLAHRLGEGLSNIDEEVVAAFSAVLPADDYLPLLLSVTPRLVTPMHPGDYFAEEQVSTWGVDQFWGLPHSPKTPYYRTFETAVSEPSVRPRTTRRQSHLYEFVVPMVPPTWNDPTVVDEYSRRVSESSMPTAVAVSTLDVCEPVVTGPGAQDQDDYCHWGLTHFLLDGHHKTHAAAVVARPLQLLAFVGIGASLATREQMRALSQVRAQEPASRPAHGS